MDDLILLYVTCENIEEAKNLSYALCKDRLVACANIIQPHIAIYQWDGVVKEEREVLVIFKTRRDFAAKVMEQINAIHSYDVPCILLLPIEGGNENYLRWLHGQVG